jgi:hypothetical protein
MNAFPIAIPAGCEGYEDGMTLRDYFAGQVLAGRLSDSSTPFDIFVARYAYRIADIMLEARGE